MKFPADAKVIEEFPDGINPDLLIPKRNSPPEMLFNPRFADLFTVAREIFNASVETKETPNV